MGIFADVVLFILTTAFLAWWGLTFDLIHGLGRWCPACRIGWHDFNYFELPERRICRCCCAKERAA